MKLNKNSEHKSWRHLPGWGTHWCARSLMHPDPMGREPGSSAFRISLPHPTPKVSPMCVFTWMVLICILHKTVIISIAFSGVLLFYSSKLWHLGRSRGLWELLGFVGSWQDNAGGLGTPKFKWFTQLAFEVRAILLGTMSLILWCLMLTLDG